MGDKIMFEKAGKTYVIIRLAEDWQYPERKKKITIADVAAYFATQANNLSSGMRCIAGEYGDWRMIDHIAQDCLSYFKQVNVEGIRRAGRKLGLTPKF